MSKIRNIREQLGLMQYEFAELIGVRQSTVSRWEHGLSLPDMNSLMLVREACRNQGRKFPDAFFFDLASPEQKKASRNPAPSRKPSRGRPQTSSTAARNRPRKSLSNGRSPS